MILIPHYPQDGPEREGYENFFEEVPASFTEQEREEWLSKLTEVAVSSDAFVSFLFISLSSKLCATELCIHRCPIANSNANNFSNLLKPIASTFLLAGGVMGRGSHEIWCLYLLLMLGRDYCRRDIC